MVEYVYLENAPHTDEYGGPEPVDEYAMLPQPFLDALAHLLAHVDSVSCWRCGEPAGYVLAERGDFEVVAWRTSALAREDNGPVAVLCDDCAPYVPAGPQGPEPQRRT